MYKFYFLILFISSELLASNFGITGLIDTPTARIQSDGTLKVTFSHRDIANITNITYQATPWLETTFRYTYGESLKDRSYAAKIVILEEGRFKPNIAIGAQDILGTGEWASEYIVASKDIKNFDVTVGLGWGRLAGYNSIKNPLLRISDSFLNRDKDGNIGGRQGGKIRTDSFFSGSKAGIFGGIKYKIPNTNFKLLAEYNSDSYSREMSLGIINKNSPMSYGIEWNGLSGSILSLSHLRGNELGLAFSTILDTNLTPIKKNIQAFYSSSDKLKIPDIPKTLNFDNWYDRLLYDFEKSGLLLRKAKIYPSEKKATIEFSNFRYNLAADAINRALTLSQIHLPLEINRFDLILNENHFKVMTIRYNRNEQNNNLLDNSDYSRIKILRPDEIDNPNNYTKIRTPSLNISANIAARFQLFDPDLPLKHQVFLKIDALAHLTQNWNLSGSFAVDIDNSFDLNRGPSSRLEHVRTDISKYLVKGSSGIDSLYIEKYSSLSKNIHYRAYLGILEYMYSGAGIEILYQPFMSRFAVGGTFNRVFKRDYEREFKLLDYKTSTGFLSLYYASPFYNYDFAIHLGRYLAKDKGATIEIRRTFDNGFSIGAFVTRTDVSAADFGEGSFDKGLFFRIPFDSFTSGNTKNSFRTVLRSVQRDGGQKLDDFTGRLWFDLRNVRYDNLKNYKGRMIPK